MPEMMTTRGVLVVCSVLTAVIGISQSVSVSNLAGCRVDRLTGLVLGEGRDDLSREFGTEPRNFGDVLDGRLPQRSH